MKDSVRTMKDQEIQADFESGIGKSSMQTGAKGAVEVMTSEHLIEKPFGGKKTVMIKQFTRQSFPQE